jgi:NhaA family Na+:H+ antiporter
LFTAGILGGIGFTMSVFITLLAYTDGATVIASKTAILLSSVVAGLSGFIYFKLTAGRAVKPSE